MARVCELDLDKKRGCIWRLSPELRGCATAACLSLWTFSVDLATPAPLDPFSDNVPSSSLERRQCCGNKQRAQQLAASPWWGQTHAQLRSRGPAQRAESLAAKAALSLVPTSDPRSLPLNELVLRACRASSPVVQRAFTISISSPFPPFVQLAFTLWVTIP